MASGYPPTPPGYPPVQPGYGPMQAGYPPAQPGYPPMQAGYPPPRPPMMMMPPPPPIPGCPAGLEYLAQLDRVYIKQCVELFEAIVGIETNNKFKMYNASGQQIYFAGEDTNICMRNLCGPERGFVFHVVNNFNQPVFRLNRDFKCCKGVPICPFQYCRYFVSVEDNTGQLLGYVSNLFYVFSPTFGIFNEEQELIYEIRGPFCPIQNVCCQGDIYMPVFDNSNVAVAVIAKEYAGLAKEIFTDADSYRVDFPVSLHPKMKVLMLAAVLVIDMMLYEKAGQDHGPSFDAQG